MSGSVAQKGPKADKATNRHTVGVAEGECREQREPSTIVLLASTPSKQSRCAERRLLPRARCRCTRGQHVLRITVLGRRRPSRSLAYVTLTTHLTQQQSSCRVHVQLPTQHRLTSRRSQRYDRRSYDKESRSQFHLIRGKSLASQKFTGTRTSPKSTGTSFYAPVRSI